MKKLLLSIILVASVASPARAATDVQQRTFQARVLEVIDQKENALPDGTKVEQQDLRLQVTSGDKAGQDITFRGIGSFDVASKNLYQAGDRVLIEEDFDDAGNSKYFVTDYVRSREIYILIGIFVIILVAVSGWRGLRSLLSLAVSFLIIMLWMIPQILDGASPVAVTIIGGFVILLAVIYLTEGFKSEAHLAVASIFLALSLTVALSYLFVSLSHLSGFASEEAGFLVGLGGRAINYRGLLLAGIIIGALGVLDDVVIAQITSVEELNKANSAYSKSELFLAAHKIGVSHISSMTNTLFLAYAGASMSLLALIMSGQSAFSSWSDVLNNEGLATEIVRTLAGSVGLVLSVPISTYLAVLYFKRK